MTRDTAIATNNRRNSAYKNFAENLLALSVRNESIAKTCRDLDINRQQFNKYLSGNVLPSEATLERITKLFNIDALELFKPPSSAPASLAKEADSVKKTKRLAALENTLSELKQKPLEYQLRSGIYSYYLPYEKDISKCMRGIIAVSVEGGVTFFTRILRFDDVLSGQSYSRTIGCDGVVTQTGNKLMLVGRDRKESHAVSLLNIDTSNSVNDIYLVGLLMTFSPTNLPVALQVLLHHVGSIEAWQQHFRQSGILSVDDATIPNEVRSIMNDHTNSGGAILHSVDVHKRWRESRT
jgi:transcriptional regulator with XRE-family HTH domain